MLFLTPNQQRQGTEGKMSRKIKHAYTCLYSPVLLSLAEVSSILSAAFVCSPSVTVSFGDGSDNDRKGSNVATLFTSALKLSGGDDRPVTRLSRTTAR